MKRSIVAGTVAIIAVVAGFVGHQLASHPRVQHFVTEADIETTHYLRRFGLSCGVEAWSTKTLTDAQAGQVDLTPHLSTIAKLSTLPANSGHRTNPAQVSELRGTHLIAYKLEPDSDIHLVLRSPLPPNPTMIAEIPDPLCATGSRVLAQITAARAAFVQQVGQPQTYYVVVDDTITLDGVGFFDFLHGQRGVAPNGIELHPVVFFHKVR